MAEHKEVLQVNLKRMKEIEAELDKKFPDRDNRPIEVTQQQWVKLLELPARPAKAPILGVTFVKPLTLEQRLPKLRRCPTSKK